MNNFKKVLAGTVLLATLASTVGVVNCSADAAPYKVASYRGSRVITQEMFNLGEDREDFASEVERTPYEPYDPYGAYSDDQYVGIPNDIVLPAVQHLEWKDESAPEATATETENQQANELVATTAKEETPAVEAKKEKKPLSTTKKGLIAAGAVTAVAAAATGYALYKGHITTADIKGAPARAAGAVASGAKTAGSAVASKAKTAGSAVAQAGTRAWGGIKNGLSKIIPGKAAEPVNADINGECPAVDLDLAAGINSNDDSVCPVGSEAAYRLIETANETITNAAETAATTATEAITNAAETAAEAITNVTATAAATANETITNAAETAGESVNGVSNRLSKASKFALGTVIGGTLAGAAELFGRCARVPYACVANKEPITLKSVLLATKKGAVSFGKGAKTAGEAVATAGSAVANGAKTAATKVVGFGRGVKNAMATKKGKFAAATAVTAAATGYALHKGWITTDDIKHAPVAIAHGAKATAGFVADAARAAWTVGKAGAKVAGFTWKYKKPIAMTTGAVYVGAKTVNLVNKAVDKANEELDAANKTYNKGRRRVAQYKKIGNAVLHPVQGLKDLKARITAPEKQKPTTRVIDVRLAR